MRQFGRYELIEQIALGGMAEIWLARQYGLPDFHRIVVVKKLNEDLKESETFVRMFLDEARTSAQLTHPNVVQIFDLGFKDGEYFIAMEYIHGEDLVEITHSAVEREKLIPIGCVVRIVADALKGLHHAHTLVGSGGPLAIVHRDASPHNLLVTYDGMVKLVDFGIAKARTQTEVTGSGMLKGKHAYMSPEQVRGETIDHRSDIFTIGIVLYELSTGNRLFVGRNEVETLEAVLSAPIPKPSRVSGFPEKLEQIILRALERDPEKRYQSAQQMQLELERSISNLPGSAELGIYMHDLFGPIIEEKQRVLAFLKRSSGPPPEQWDSEEEVPPPMMTIAKKSTIEVPTDVFVRKARKHLAMGATKLGARRPSLVRAPLIVRMIAQRAPVRFKRPLAMVLAGPMVGMALVAAAAPIGVWLAGTGPAAVAQMPAQVPAPIPDPIPTLRDRAVAKFGFEGAEDFFRFCKKQETDCALLLDHVEQVSGESTDGRTKPDERRTNRKRR